LRLCFCDRTLDTFPIREIEPGASHWQKFFQARSLLHFHFQGHAYRINGWKVNNDWCRAVPLSADSGESENVGKDNTGIFVQHMEDFLNFDYEKKFNRWLCTSLELGPASPIVGVDELYTELKWLRQMAEKMI
jgi:hypothetical protein